jgi:alkylhydroperoxidase family enzyme
VTWLPQTAAGATPLDAVFGLRADAYARFRELHATLWTGVLDPAIVEMCRLRIAALLGCESEMHVRHEAARSAGLTEEKIAQLASYGRAPAFDAVERACIAFAEQYVLDPHGLSDDDFATLRALLTPAQIATVTLAAAVFDSLVRLRLALGVQPAAAAPASLTAGGAPASLP